MNLTTGEYLDAFTLNREKNFTSTNIDFGNLLFCYYYCENWVKQHPTQIKDNEWKKKTIIHIYFDDLFDFLQITFIYKKLFKNFLL